MGGELAGRVAVVTGASSGIGAATARALAAMGARVALLARRADRIDALAAELGDAAVAIPADVTDASSLAGIAAEVRSRLGRTDILVNNAGQMLNSPFDAGHTDEWRAMLELNLMAPLMVTHAFLDQLVDGGGDVVNLSSVAGRKARGTSGVYSATKWGLNGWSESLRQELQKHDVRVIVIEPGVVATELADHITHTEARESVQRIVHGSGAVLQAADVAAVIAFAVSRPAHVALNEILIRPSGQEY